MHLILLIANLIAKLQLFMKLFYSTILCCFVTSSIFAQESKLLQNFKYRIDCYRVINLGAEGAASTQKYENVTKPYFYSGTSVNGYFSVFKISDKQKYNYNISTSATINTGSENINARGTRTGTFGLSANHNKTWYFGKSFFEIGTALGSGISGIRSEKINNLISDKGNGKSIYAAITLGLGRGRLEIVNDMQSALWLNRDLAKNKNLNRTLSDEELNGLAKAITKGNNTRVLDTRRRTKFVLKTVNNYLLDKGVINKNDIDYFSTLNDNIFFINNEYRVSGKELYIRFTPQYFGSNYNNTNDGRVIITKRNNEGHDILINTGFKKYKPQNLIHQNNYGAELSYYSINSTEKQNQVDNNILVFDTKFNKQINQYAADVFFEHGIYPNTRTNINFLAKASFGTQNIVSVVKNFYKFDLKAYSSYFISFRTKFFADFGVSYQKNYYDFLRTNQYLPNRFLANIHTGLDINL